MTRVDPAISAAVLAELQQHRGRGNAVSGYWLRNRLWSATGQMPAARRIGEAVASLVEAGHPIGSSGAAGYWWISSEAERLEARREIVTRLSALGRRLRAFDAGAAERVDQLTLELDGARTNFTEQAAPRDTGSAA